VPAQTACADTGIDNNLTVLLAKTHPAPGHA